MAKDASLPITITLDYRPPYDWPAMLEFFKTRAIPGVEWVEKGAYHRTIRINATRGAISVTHAAIGNSLLLTAQLSGSRHPMPLAARVRRMFDLDADMAAIHAVLSADPVLARIVRRNPGLRLPGAWDPFEVAVRAVVGQQVSVKGARTIAGRIAAKAGPQFDTLQHPRLNRYFPDAGELSVCDLDGLGMPGKRARTIQELARAVVSGQFCFTTDTRLKDFIDQLTRIPGIGDWTAQYIAMRALSEPDAFPAADLGIAKSLQQTGVRPTPAQIRNRAENWRPWRSYAAVYLWHG